MFNMIILLLFLLLLLLLLLLSIYLLKTHIKMNINLKIKHALNSVLSNKSWMMKFPQTLNFNISHLLQQ